MKLVDALLSALSMAFMMGWEILWALMLGFALSGIVQAVVTKGEMSRLLPDSSPRSIVIATGLGVASSSCSYAAVALARSIFRKGGNFIAAMAFQFASTNLVIELGIILAVLMGWQFVAAEFAGGIMMIVLLTMMLRVVMSRERVEEAKRQADRGIAGRMEGHAEMDMSVGGEGSIFSRIMSPEGFTAISHYFVMDWASVWIDIALGLLIAGALAAWVPQEFWQAFFLSTDPLGSKIVGPLIGPIVAIGGLLSLVRPASRMGRGASEGGACGATEQTPAVGCGGRDLRQTVSASVALLWRFRAVFAVPILYSTTARTDAGVSSHHHRAASHHAVADRPHGSGAEPR